MLKYHALRQCNISIVFLLFNICLIQELEKSHGNGQYIVSGKLQYICGVMNWGVFVLKIKTK